jgi:hypothetical protein
VRDLGGGLDCQKSLSSLVTVGFFPIILRIHAYLGRIGPFDGLKEVLLQISVESSGISLSVTPEAPLA